MAAYLLACLLSGQFHLDVSAVIAYFRACRTAKRNYICNADKKVLKCSVLPVHADKSCIIIDMLCRAIEPMLRLSGSASSACFASA